MSGLWSFLVSQFYENQFMTAAVVAAPMTALVYTARNLPVRLFQLLKRHLTVEVSFNSDIPDYLAVQEFVGARLISERWSRSFLYASERKWDPGTQAEQTINRGLTPGYGVHLGFWRRRFVWVSRQMTEGQQTEKFKERLSLTFLTRSRALVRDFAAQVREYGEQSVDRENVSLFINTGGWWRFASKLPRRGLETIFTANGEADALVRHVRDFEKRRDWYRQRGLPYHTGVLLTGKPGTGKTSLMHALASELERSLHYLNLGGVENDQQLTELVSGGRNWSRTLLVIEDADASGAHVHRAAPSPLTPSAPEPEPRKPLTLSALLNLLDGLLTPDGLVVVATSNHPELLDPALIRAGRFDLHLELGDLGWPEFVAMARLFGFELQEGDPRRASYRPLPGADLRAALLSGGVEAVLSERLGKAA